MEEYRAKVDCVKKKYEPRILTLLERVKEDLIDTGYTVEGPDYCADETYSWSLSVYYPKSNLDGPGGADIDVCVEIAESEAYDGTLNGINFSLTVVESGGGILGQFVPYNYTREVWVSLDDPIAIERRWEMFEQVDDIVRCTKKG